MLNSDAEMEDALNKKCWNKIKTKNKVKGRNKKIREKSTKKTYGLVI